MVLTLGSRLYSAGESRRGTLEVDDKARRAAIKRGSWKRMFKVDGTQAYSLLSWIEPCEETGRVFNSGFTASSLVQLLATGLQTS
jgi:hypothetical protein